MKKFKNIVWYCDRCGSCLSKQEKFDDHHYVWKCTNCGYKNCISKACIIKNSKENNLEYDELNKCVKNT